MRRLAGAALALALIASGCGKGDEREREDPFAAVERAPAKRERTSAPRWEPLAGFGAAGARSFEVSRRAIQWRARWRCRTGTLRLSASQRGLGGRPRVARRCPGRGRESWVGGGPAKLTVEGASGVRVVVEQQVDTPLREPPLPAMRAPGARVVARGTFHRIERRGRGSAVLHRLANGRLALRLSGFETSSNTDLFVWLSEHRGPRTTRAAVRAPHVEMALLKSTLGDQNYLLPRGTDLERVRSIVIWCEPIRIAYTAAGLRRVSEASSPSPNTSSATPP